MTVDGEPQRPTAVPASVSIAPMHHGHWPQVERIYAAGIATGHATFERTPPSWDEFDASKLSAHRWVALRVGLSEPERVVGWVAASSVSDRCAYAGVAEHSVYVDPEASGRGIGRLLLETLIASTQRAGIWTLQAGIFPENTASLRLHTRAGFRVVGTRERLGLMSSGPLSGRWRDVVLVERRSAGAELVTR